MEAVPRPTGVTRPLAPLCLAAGAATGARTRPLAQRAPLEQALQLPRRGALIAAAAWALAAPRAWAAGPGAAALLPPAAIQPQLAPDQSTFDPAGALWLNCKM